MAGDIWAKIGATQDHMAAEATERASAITDQLETQIKKKKDLRNMSQELSNLRNAPDGYVTVGQMSGLAQEMQGAGVNGSSTAWNNIQADANSGGNWSSYSYANGGYVSAADDKGHKYGALHVSSTNSSDDADVKKANAELDGLKQALDNAANSVGDDQTVTNLQLTQATNDLTNAQAKRADTEKKRQQAAEKSEQVLG